MNNLDNNLYHNFIMNALNYVCPVPGCNSAKGAQCTFKVKDGRQVMKEPHMQRVRVGIVAEGCKQQDNEGALDYSVRLDKLINEIINEWA